VLSKNEKKAARAIQAECGVKYTRAVTFVRENYHRILELIKDENGNPNWRDWQAAAAGLWRTVNGDSE
jgi:hypothetical protein